MREIESERKEDPSVPSARATRPEGRGPSAPLPDSTSRQINPPPTTTRYGQCARDGASSFVLFAQPSATSRSLAGAGSRKDIRVRTPNEFEYALIDVNPLAPRPSSSSSCARGTLERNKFPSSGSPLFPESRTFPLRTCVPYIDPTWPKSKISTTGSSSSSPSPPNPCFHPVVVAIVIVSVLSSASSFPALLSTFYCAFLFHR